jgi:hypothetical protein
MQVLFECNWGADDNEARKEKTNQQG